MEDRATRSEDDPYLETLVSNPQDQETLRDCYNLSHISTDKEQMKVYLQV